jgi:hypothetical protein
MAAIFSGKCHISVFFSRIKTTHISVFFGTLVCPSKWAYFRGFLARYAPQMANLEGVFSAEVCHLKEQYFSSIWEVQYPNTYGNVASAFCLQ